MINRFVGVKFCFNVDEEVGSRSILHLRSAAAEAIKVSPFGRYGEIEVFPGN